MTTPHCNNTNEQDRHPSPPITTSRPPPRNHNEVYIYRDRFFFLQFPHPLLHYYDADMTPSYISPNLTTIIITTQNYQVLPQMTISLQPPQPSLKFQHIHSQPPHSYEPPSLQLPTPTSTPEHSHHSYHYNNLLNPLQQNAYHQLH